MAASNACSLVRDSGAGGFLCILWNFQEHLFYRTPLVTAFNACSLVRTFGIGYCNEIECDLQWKRTKRYCRKCLVAMKGEIKTKKMKNGRYKCGIY